MVGDSLVICFQKIYHVRQEDTFLNVGDELTVKDNPLP